MNQEMIARPVVVCCNCAQQFLSVYTGGLCPDCYYGTLSDMERERFQRGIRHAAVS